MAIIPVKLFYLGSGELGLVHFLENSDRMLGGFGHPSGELGLPPSELGLPQFYYKITYQYNYMNLLYIFCIICLTLQVNNIS